MGENIMPENKRQKLRRAILRDEFDTFITAGRLLKNSRAMLGVGTEFISKKFGIDHRKWQQYENDRVKIPNTLLLKIFVFGLSFWCNMPDNAMPQHMDKDL